MAGTCVASTVHSKQVPEHRVLPCCWEFGWLKLHGGYICALSFGVPPPPQILNHWLDFLAWSQARLINTDLLGDRWILGWPKNLSYHHRSSLIFLFVPVGLSPCRWGCYACLLCHGSQVPFPHEAACLAATWQWAEKNGFLEFWKSPSKGKFPKIFSPYPRLCHPFVHIDRCRDAHIVNTFHRSCTQ